MNQGVKIAKTTLWDLAQVVFWVAASPIWVPLFIILCFYNAVFVDWYKSAKRRASL